MRIVLPHFLPNRFPPSLSWYWYHIFLFHYNLLTCHSLEQDSILQLFGKVCFAPRYAQARKVIKMLCGEFLEKFVWHFFLCFRKKRSMASYIKQHARARFAGSVACNGT